MAARFVRESRLAGALNHASIVTVLDFFEHDGTPYIAMEYVPRGSLRPWVGRLELAQVGGVLESVLAGLAHAHAPGVVHRDLKPENLMVTDEGRVKITDFGIAKALDDGSGTVPSRPRPARDRDPRLHGARAGDGQEIGPWTDLYAVGVIAYELLSGSVPFSAREPLAVLLAHCRRSRRRWPSARRTVPSPIAGWVHALLAKEPAARPQSARAAWEELEEHLLEGVGPRWRRGARLEGDLDVPPPVTAGPAPTSDQWTTVAGDAPRRRSPNRPTRCNPRRRFADPVPDPPDAVASPGAPESAPATPPPTPFVLDAADPLRSAPAPARPPPAEPDRRPAATTPPTGGRKRPTPAATTTPPRSTRRPPPPRGCRSGRRQPRPPSLRADGGRCSLSDGRPRRRGGAGRGRACGRG